MRRSDAGYVTAETAMVVPSLVLLVGMMLWGLTATAGMIQCIDGARAGARAAARGEPPETVREVARSAAPPGATVRLSRDGDMVRVRVAAETGGPEPLALPLEAEAVALAEGTFAQKPRTLAGSTTRPATTRSLTTTSAATRFTPVTPAPAWADAVSGGGR